MTRFLYYHRPITPIVRGFVFTIFFLNTGRFVKYVVYIGTVVRFKVATSFVVYFTTIGLALRLERFFHRLRV